MGGELGTSLPLQISAATNERLKRLIEVELLIVSMA